MSKSTKDKRSELVKAALDLAHRQGLASTTLADIAGEAKVPLGNVYYYFKTKDEIANAVVGDHAAQFQMFCERLEKSSSPRERLEAFVQSTLDNRATLARSGCPLGALTHDLQRKGGAVAKKASALLANPLTWMEEQFRALGKPREARSLAIHLLSALQGVAVVAHCLHDADVVAVEVDRLKSWLRKL